MRELELESDQSRIFKASQYWSSNVWGAALAGFGAAILMSVMIGIVFWNTQALKVVLFLAALALVLVISLLCLFPGNWIAAFPYAVAVEEGKGLRLYAPFKKIYVPIGDLRDVRRSVLQQGFVVRLKRRHRLLTSFVIHWFFGSQAEPLAHAIQEEIRRHTS